MKIRSIIKDKKAQSNQFSVFGIFVFMVTALVVVLFFAGLIYIQGLLHSTFDRAGIQNEANAGNRGYTNMSAASDEIWGTLDNSIQSLKMVAGIYILALAICMIISNAIVKLHPMWFFAYILLSVLAIVFSVPISNAYQNLAVTGSDCLALHPLDPEVCGMFGTSLQGFTVSNWILINLPVFVLVLAVLGGIFMFISLIRSEGGSTFQ